MLQGTAKIVIRNLNTKTKTAEIIKSIKSSGVQLVQLYMLKNKISGKFTGIIKATLIGNDILQ